MGSYQNGGGGEGSLLGFNTAKFVFTPPKNFFYSAKYLKMIFPWRRGRLL